MKKQDYRLGQSYIDKNQKWNIDSTLNFIKLAKHRDLIEICKYDNPEQKMEKNRRFYTKQSKQLSPHKLVLDVFNDFKNIFKFFYFGLLKHK